MRGLGDLDLRAGAYASARDHFAAAITIYEAAGIGMGEQADVQLGLAKALWALDEDRPRALELAAKAKAGYDATSWANGLTEVAEFLRDKPSR